MGGGRGDCIQGGMTVVISKKVNAIFSVSQTHPLKERLLFGYLWFPLLGKEGSRRLLVGIII